MNVTITLESGQAGPLITLSAAQLASIDQQRAAPPTTSPPSTGGTTEWTYPFNQLNDDDRRWLVPAQYQYSVAIKNAPHVAGWTGNQLIPDLLTSGGKTLWQLTGSAASTFQNQQSQLINRIRAGGDLYDPNYGAAQAAAYNGPLKARLANLIARKLAGL